MHSQVLVSGAFDDVRSSQIRFLEQASKLGELTVLLWTDAVTEKRLGSAPKFSEVERRYFLQALRWVRDVRLVSTLDDTDTLPAPALKDTSALWAVQEGEDSTQKRNFCLKNGLGYRVLSNCPV